MNQEIDRHQKNPVTLEGTVEGITYYNPENHFTIARFALEGRKDLISVTGYFVGLSAGETLRLHGHYKKHPKYGLQFRVESYEALVPATLQGIERYLGSGLIKGIGPEMAKRIVKRFGLQALEIIERDIEQLAQVPGVGPKRILQLKAAWREQREIRNLMVFLRGFGVSTGLATKIFKTYGVRAVPRLQENPYCLVEDVSGVGFITADRMAQKMGIDKHSPLRLKAGLLYLLQQKSEEGHVFLPEGELLAAASQQLEVDHGPLHEALEVLIQQRQVLVQSNERAGRNIFLPYLEVSEEGVARRLQVLMQTLPDRDPIPPGRLEETEKSLKLTLSERQREAVQQALQQKVFIITGGPGTGKTTLIRVILEIFHRSKKRCLLLAPTGRAAKRLSEVTRFPAATIHRGLGYNPQSGGFQKNERHPVAADLVVVDEASMVDTVLMHQLLKAVPDSARLIMVGDIFQLPSVGPGNVLSDLIQSAKIPVVHLDHIFRQGPGSLIAINAHRIHQGEMPFFPTGEDRENRECYFVYQEDPEKAVQWILELVQNKLPGRYGLDPMRDIQVLTPMYRGPVGAEHLNKNSKLWESGPRVFRMGDKVMQIRNNYDKEVFNGDIGRLSGIDRERQEVFVNFDGRFVAYDFSELDELVLAYAVSVHKSQGNEYPAVVMPIMMQHYILLQRNLVYTAVTRAKKVLVLVGTQKALAVAIKNNKTQQRYSFLKDRLLRLSG